MEKKDAGFLEQIFKKTSRLNMQINAKLEEIETWRHLATKAEIVFGAGGPGKNKNQRKSKVEDCVCKIMEIEEAIKGDMDNLLALKEELMHIVNAMDVPEYKSLLIHRYICGKKWDDVADSMGYSYVHTVHRLRPKALERLNEINKIGDDR